MKVLNSLLVLLSLFVMAGCHDSRESEYGAATTQQASGGGAPWVGKVDGPAICVPVGEFFLVEQRGNYAAVKVTKDATVGDCSADYIWYYSADGLGVFTGKAARQGTGTVCERYETTISVGGAELVRDAGSRPYIRCGPMAVLWSMSNWIYFDTPTGRVRIALTGTSDIREVNYLDKGLVWH